MKSCVDKVLVVGGGVAGLAAAAALAGKGVAVDLVEISSTGEPVGAAITLVNRAFDAMDEIGVLDQIEAVKGDTDMSTIGPFGADGQSLLPPGMKPDSPFRRVAGVYRPVLSKILRERALSLGVQLRLGTTVTALEETPQGVRATLSDGSTGLYDLVVGADGIRSKVRAMVFPDAASPAYAGQCAIRWMAKGPAITSGPSGLYHTPFGKFLGYPLPAHNLIYLAVVCDGDPGRHVSSQEARDMLREKLAPFTAPYMVELRQRLTDDDDVIFRPFEWHLIDGPWHTGRVLLIGDAAHATTAHMSYGGGMAVEDAVVLAQEIAAQPSLDAALAAFMARRLDRVRIAVTSSLAASRLEVDNAPVPQIIGSLAPAFMKLMEPY